MRKKIGVCCLLGILLIVCLPVVSSDSLMMKQTSHALPGDELSLSDNQVTSSAPVLTGYLLIHVSVYTPGQGMHPFVGANISVKGLFYKYNGQTDDQGDCLFQLHTKLFRTKLYFIKVSILPGDLLHTKINSLYIQSRQVVYKDFLFIAL